MHNILIADTTLCSNGFSFKEKLEIARQLEKLNVDIIELPEISNVKTDTLLIRTVSAFVKGSTVSVAAGSNAESVENALAALNNAAKPLIRIELPISPVGMEYTCHKKPAKMLEWITRSVEMAKEGGVQVECCFLDATRAEKEFLEAAIKAAEAAGASRISICDSAAEMMPDDFAEFAASVMKMTSLPVGVGCDDRNSFASAQAILAVRKGASSVKTGSGSVPLESFASMIKNCGVSYDFSSNIKYTELHRIMKQIQRITRAISLDSSTIVSSNDDNGIRLDSADDKASVINAVAMLGYDLSAEDQTKVYEEFLRVAAKKAIGAKELDAIVASVALQVPATYKLENYVINSGNVLSSSAQISMTKEGAALNGISTGDGPIDAAFKALEQIIGRHYELDDFQIQSVTEGQGAMGSALVKLRNEGKVYSGNGISTDIISASIRAYISAVNKIVYEEEQA